MNAQKSNEIRRNLNVENAASELDRSVIDLHEAVEALEHHLEPLLACKSPVSAGEERRKGESELAERILSNADSISSRSARIRDLIERL